MLDIFPDGTRWFQCCGKGSKVLDFKRMAAILFGDCGKQDICVKRPTLHGIAEEAEVAALNSVNFHEELKAYAGEVNDYGWSIAIAPSVQHFHSKPGQVSDHDTGKACGASGAYSPGAHASLEMVRCLPLKAFV